MYDRRVKSNWPVLLTWGNKVNRPLSSGIWTDKYWIGLVRQAEVKGSRSLNTDRLQGFSSAHSASKELIWNMGANSLALLHMPSLIPSFYTLSMVSLAKLCWNWKKKTFNIAKNSLENAKGKSSMHIKTRNIKNELVKINEKTFSNKKWHWKLILSKEMI